MVCRARLSWRSPPRFSRCLVTCPEDAGIGLAPARAAKGEWPTAPAAPPDHHADAARLGRRPGPPAPPGERPGVALGAGAARRPLGPPDLDHQLAAGLQEGGQPGAVAASTLHRPATPARHLGLAELEQMLVAGQVGRRRSLCQGAADAIGGCGGQGVAVGVDPDHPIDGVGQPGHPDRAPFQQTPGRVGLKAPRGASVGERTRCAVRCQSPDCSWRATGASAPGADQDPPREGKLCPHAFANCNHPDCRELSPSPARGPTGFRCAGARTRPSATSRDRRSCHHPCSGRGSRASRPQGGSGCGHPAAQVHGR
jgi:hypothetical protein